MRNFLFITSFCLLHLSLLGQEVIASDGNFSSSAQGSLSWTLGEVISETVSNSGGIFTQGFQQNYEDILGLHSAPQISGMDVYPNPFSNEIFLAIEGLDDLVQIEIFDVGGREIFSSQLFFQSSLHTQKISLANFLPGTYFLRITPHATLDHFTFPIIKAY